MSGALKRQPALVTPRPLGMNRRRERTPQERVAKRCAWGLAIFMVALPLQWYSLGSGPLGTVRYFHVAAVIMLLIARPPLSMLRTAANEARPVFPAATVVVVVGTVTGLGWHSGSTVYVQSGYYVFFGLVAAACLIIALTDRRAQRILAVAAPVAVVVFMLAITVSIHRAGVNIGSTVAQALGGNPRILEFGVFRPAFRTVAANARSNLRHEVFGAIAVIFYIGVVASSRADYLRKTLFVTAIASAGLVVLSVSRSVLLGVAVTAAIGVSRVAVANRIKIGTFLIGLVGLFAVPFAIVKLLPLLSARFTDSGSYDSRLTAVTESTYGLGGRLLLGGPIPSLSTQNLVLDTMLRAGIVAGVAALVMELIFIFLTMRVISLYYRVGRVYALAAVGAAMQLLVRSFTGGQNLMHQVEWFALALVIAVLYLDDTSPAGRKAAGLSRQESAALVADPVPVRPAKSDGVGMRRGRT